MTIFERFLWFCRRLLAEFVATASCWRILSLSLKSCSELEVGVRNLGRDGGGGMGSGGGVATGICGLYACLRAGSGVFLSRRFLFFSSGLVRLDLDPMVRLVSDKLMMSFF